MHVASYLLSYFTKKHFLVNDVRVIVDTNRDINVVLAAGVSPSNDNYNCN